MRRERFVPISVCLRRPEIRDQLSEDGEATSSEDADSIYVRRLEGGLFTLQTLDYILAWLIMEDDGVRNEISFTFVSTFIDTFADPTSRYSHVEPQKSICE